MLHNDDILTLSRAVRVLDDDLLEDVAGEYWPVRHNLVTACSIQRTPIGIVSAWGFEVVRHGY
jgi:hypothetical protein